MFNILIKKKRKLVNYTRIMEPDDTDNSGAVNVVEDESRSAVNSLILDYYKRFGRKRDLEQYFSLSTAQSEIRDPTGLFWRRMKSQNDSSDSGEKRSESPIELCRISIKCTAPDPSSSQDENPNTKSDSESPPIITEDNADCTRHSDDEFVKSDDNHSQKSADATLDISTNKPLSPTSSITSQRKLEWDSLADVGYANESDRKNSASSLSTLERLALKQQYSNDTKQNSNFGPPTDHSTPLDTSDNKCKSKRDIMKKTMKFYKKDVEMVEVNVPHTSGTSSAQAINVNLTKRISFNVEKDGEVTVENVKQDVVVNPEKVSVETEMTPQVTLDKNVQTSLTKTKEKSSSSMDMPKLTKSSNLCSQKAPVIISLNTLRRRSRRRKLRTARRKVRAKKKSCDEIQPTSVHEKSGEPVSEAESFEYMPGHMYNQNQMTNDESKVASAAGNKSSLESSAGNTTESDKVSKLSFTKDLEKNIDLIYAALQKHQNNSNMKDKLIKEIVQRLLKTKYRDDESTTDFLSGLSLSSKILALSKGHYTTTSSSDANNTEGNAKMTRPKKSILRVEKFNSNAIFSTSQSAPNLPSVSNSEKPVSSHLSKPMSFSNTESDVSSKEKNSSDTAFAKTSSEELYHKYIEALRREEAYKKHLKDKEMFMRQKLVCSDTAFQVPISATKNNNRLKDLINDLTRNNYDDGSGDASKLEGGSNSNMDFERFNIPRKQKSHSVFTLSSGNSEQNKKNSIRSKLQNQIKLTPRTTGTDEYHYCCCPHHSKHSKIDVTDSSVQVNIKHKCGEGTSSESDRKETVIGSENQRSNKGSPRNTLRAVSDSITGDIKYVCLCTDKAAVSPKASENFLIYKCSRLTTRGVQNEDAPFKESNTVSVQCSSKCSSPHKSKETKFGQVVAECYKKPEIKNPRYLKTIDSNNLNDVLKNTKSSQTNINLDLNMLRQRSAHGSVASSSSENTRIHNVSPKLNTHKNVFEPQKVEDKLIHENVRWIQTEISIDPKISDATLSDVNIINDKDCVKLVCEQYRTISKPVSESDSKDRNYLPQIDAASERSDGNDALPDDNGGEKPFKIEQKKLNKEIQSDIDQTTTNIKCQDYDVPNRDTVSDKFTIPIQGTNMTLMVSIGSKDRKTVAVEGNNNNEVISRETTDKTKFVEKSTFLGEDCCKAVQCQNTNIFTDMIDDKTAEKSADVDFNSNKINKATANLKENVYSLQKSCLVNTGLMEATQKYNTYPKSVQISERKSLRTNTDNLEKECCIQTDRVDKRNMETQHDFQKLMMKSSKEMSLCNNNMEKYQSSSDKSSKCTVSSTENKDNLTSGEKLQSRKSSSESIPRRDNLEGITKDPIMDIIKDITKRYTKIDIEKDKRRCFKEIITVLNYLLDTEESTDYDQIKTSESGSTQDTDRRCNFKKTENKTTTDSSQGQICPSSETKKFVDKGVQLSVKKSKSKKICNTESSDVPISSDLPGTSSESATCKVLNKIKLECEKYHQKRCKSSHSGVKKCDASSTTSVNCERCKRVHHCSCRHKCKVHKLKTTTEKNKKNCIAYNLIIQTSDSIVSEETVCDNDRRQLQNIIVKVPPKRKGVEKVPFKEISSKIEQDMLHCSPRCSKNNRSSSLPNESASSTDCNRKFQKYTVRDYLEQNRPDFVDKTARRQNCLKLISESRANERAAQRELLSLQLERQPTLNTVSSADLRRFAKEIGLELRNKKLSPKFISEREMKQHSERIYKSLPEVVQRKEEIKKENIKKTNLLMANIFKKNLQKKTLRGAVNLSNYSTIVTI